MSPRQCSVTRYNCDGMLRTEAVFRSLIFADIGEYSSPLREWLHL